MLEDLKVYNEKKCLFFALGRGAMYAACRMLGIVSGDEVLTPAFDCDAALQPFKVLGCKIRFFRSSPLNFAADIDDIKRKITPRTKLLHLINHFGMPQPWDELLKLKSLTGVPVLEDNAYSLFSEFKRQPLGTFGDMSIFSLRKNLPLPDGGMLRVNNPKYLDRALAPPPLSYKFNKAWLLSGIARSDTGWYKLARKIKAVIQGKTAVEPPPLYSDKEGYPHWPLRDAVDGGFAADPLKPVSRFSLRRLSRYSGVEYRDIISKKREYYSWLVKEILPVKGIEVLWPDLPEGAVPSCLFLLVSGQRDLFWRILRGKYEVLAWPTLSKMVLDELDDFPELRTLGRQLLLLNLPADMVQLSGFAGYLRDFIRDIKSLSRRFLI